MNVSSAPNANETQSLNDFSTKMQVSNAFSWGGITSARSLRPTPEPRPRAHSGHGHLESLPPLEGIAYQQVTAQDGRPCIIATGNTQAKKELLTGAGFRWNAQRKLWWKYVDAA